MDSTRDLEPEVDPADAADQRRSVTEGTESLGATAPFEANPADAAEQAAPVPYDEDDERPA